MIVRDRSQREIFTMSLSRREFLTLALGGGGIVTACACSGSLIGAYLLVSRRPDEIAVVASPTVIQPSPTTTFPPALPLITRAQWGALEPNHDAEFENGFFSAENTDGWRVYDGDLRAIYRTVVIHHSVVYAHDDLSSVLDVQTLHREERQWADIGYHYLIGKEGAIYEGRPLEVRGVHVGGYNTGSVGVCLLGNFMEELPTSPQIESTTALVQWLTQRLGLTHLGSHRQFNSETLCPGDNLLPYLDDFATNAGLVIGTDGNPTATPAATPAETSYRGCACHI